MSKQSELENNAEYQRRKLMSHDERAIISRDRLAKTIHDQAKKEGKDTSFDSAFRKATEIAHRGERERGGKNRR